MTSYAPPSLRRLVLAAGVLHGVDVIATDGGAVLAGWAPVLGWDLLACAVEAGVPERAAAARLADQLLALQIAASLSGRGERDQRAAVRPLARTRDALDHPGLAWVRRAVPGGALDLGPALVDAGAEAGGEAGGAASGTGDAAAREPAARPLTPWVRTALAEPGGGFAPPAAVWATALRHLERSGARAAERFARGDLVLRPVDGCDVPTLLCSAALRCALAEQDGTGMRGVAVPMRSRGWVDLTGVDPAFAVAAAAATDPLERGLVGPVLVTAHEVALARMGRHPARVPLRDG